MHRAIAIVVCLVVALGVLATFGGQPAHAATCADYPNQAAAQRAADTRDGDGDGIYCESLPCPCAKPGGDAGGGGPDAGPAGRRPTRRAACSPRGVQTSRSARPSTRTSAATSCDALRTGWPRTLVLNRPGADARRDRLLAAFATRPGQDRDEYPPAVGRGKGAGLERGRQPARLAGRRALRARSARTARTARRWASSCGASATARASATSSTRTGWYETAVLRPRALRRLRPHRGERE